MDFVISKVAMSACAFLVAGVLSGCMDPLSFTDQEGELDGVVKRFCGLVDRAALSHSRTCLAWDVPFMADGQGIGMVIHRGLVMAEAGKENAIGQPVTGIHTWQDPGASMNATVLRLLDESGDALVASSGDRVLLVTELVLLDGLPTYLVFARSGP